MIICILNLVISSKIIAIQLTNFLITAYQYLPKWWIYLRPSREMQLEKKKSSTSNPGLHLPCLNLFKPKTKCLNVCIKNSNNLVLTEKYKAYRNALNRLLRLAKRNYYHSVLNGHTVTDEEIIAEEFNSYFVNIGKSMADAISPGSACNFNFSATNKNSNSLFSYAKLSSRSF